MASDPTMDYADLLDGCEARLGYRFQDRSLLLSALTHASGAASRLRSNERLEFLGDSILGMVVCEVLYHDYPDLLEGELTRIKSVVVSRVTCARISSELGLQEFLLLGKGMTSVSQIPRSLLADVFESLVAAIYLDGGMDPARDFILQHVGPRIAPVASGDAGENYKSDLPATRPARICEDAFVLPRPRERPRSQQDVSGRGSSWRPYV